SILIGEFFALSAKYILSCQFLESAVALRRRAFGEFHELTLDSLTKLGGSQTAVGDLQSAEESLRNALALSERILGERSPSTAKLLRNLALLLYSRKEFDEAARLLNRCLAIWTNTDNGQVHQVAAVL